MKKFVLLIVLVPFVFISCTKDKQVEIDNHNSQDVESQWKSTVAPSDIIVLQPGPSLLKDAQLRHQYYNNYINKNFGDRPYGGAWCSDYSINYYRGLIEFDISTIPNLPVHSVILKLHGQPRGEMSNMPNRGDVSAYRVTSPWEEMVVTWNTQPTHSNVIIDTESPTTLKWYEWDITQLYIDWKSGIYPNYGIMLINNLEGTYRTGIVLKSNDYPDPAYLPILEITFAIPDLTAEIDVKPEKIVMKSNAKWINAFIELPVGYLVGDIVEQSIKLYKVDSQIISPFIYIDGNGQIGDYDGDGIDDLKVRFDQQELKTHLIGTGNVTLAINGQLSDGTTFGGEDIVEIK